MSENKCEIVFCRGPNTSDGKPTYLVNCPFRINPESLGISFEKGYPGTPAIHDNFGRTWPPHLVRQICECRQNH